MSKSLKSLHQEMRLLRANVEAIADETMRGWNPFLHRTEIRPSIQNLAHYLALRRHDLRKLQIKLADRGLSSLGRCESKVMPNLDAVLANLECLSSGKSSTRNPGSKAFAYGEKHLHLESGRLFGTTRRKREARIIVTLPGDCANDVSWLTDLMKKGMDVARINLAHEDQDTWKKMVRGLALARKITGLDCRVLMDLGGPKLRTGSVTPLTRRKKIRTGDTFWLAADSAPSGDLMDAAFWVQCTLPEAFEPLLPAARVYLDDGAVTCAVKIAKPRKALLEVMRTDDGGKKIKPDKGINMPDTPLSIPALTKKDKEDLPFALRHADLLGYSFVQTPEDVTALHQAMLEHGHPPDKGPFLVLKIETARAVLNFPTLCVSATGMAPASVMIARGDLAVEIGFLRLAEMQEELLWLCEAAHLPAIWATQVLENLVKRGIPSRAEITDASMAVRADAVMLNKGPFLPEAVTTLDMVLRSMQMHHHHKTPLLRALQSWQTV